MNVCIVNLMLWSPDNLNESTRIAIDKAAWSNAAGLVQWSFCCTNFSIVRCFKSWTSIILPRSDKTDSHYVIMLLQCGSLICILSRLLGPLFRFEIMNGTLYWLPHWISASVPTAYSLGFHVTNRLHRICDSGDTHFKWLLSHLFQDSFSPALA